MYNAIIVASVGLVLTIVATLFMLLSDFGCVTGNVGSAGITGPLGPTGDRGSQKQVVFSAEPDLIAHNLTIGNGHTQPSFAGNFLQDSSKGYMISWWLLSALSSSTTVKLNFQMYNNDTQVALVPDTSSITVGLDDIVGLDDVVGLDDITLSLTVVANVRQELSVLIYIWKIDNKRFNVAIEGQKGLFTGTVGSDTTNNNIAMRLKVTEASGYNRANSVQVFKDTQVDKFWCTGNI